MDFQQNPPPHVTDYGFESSEPAWWNFVLPNGRCANVSLSKWPFRFDIEYDGDDGMFTATGLTSEQLASINLHDYRAAVQILTNIANAGNVDLAADLLSALVEAGVTAVEERAGRSVTTTVIGFRGGRIG